MPITSVIRLRSKKSSSAEDRSSSCNMVVLQMRQEESENQKGHPKAALRCIDDLRIRSAGESAPGACLGYGCFGFHYTPPFRRKNWPRERYRQYSWAECKPQRGR